MNEELHFSMIFDADKLKNLFWTPLYYFRSFAHVSITITDKLSANGKISDGEGALCSVVIIMFQFNFLMRLKISY